MDDYYILERENTDPARLKKEREKTRKLKKSDWWNSQVSKGICYYCKQSFLPSELSLDHLVPLARGGRTQAGNVVPSCLPCNINKKLHTPVDLLLEQINKESR